uniref:uncharacterized protein LOC122591736 n=1 Tax=Erigeron canadensis TaxID=72917 RepID=UPI001CB9166F|nr:uncharacterized protein LOC122591736 [Erigeron canadensis]
MSSALSLSSSSDDYESDEYESINRVVTQMNAIFNPETIGACLSVIFDEEENQSQEASSSSRSKLTRRVIQLVFLDEYLQMAQDTSYQCLDQFCKCVIHLYRDEYLRMPTEADIERLTAKYAEVHGFPGMLTLVLLFGKRYHLAEGIYPEWVTLVKYFKFLMDPKTSKFKRYQEAARKDIERAFGVLQGR